MEGNAGLGGERQSLPSWQTAEVEADNTKTHQRNNGFQGPNSNKGTRAQDTLLQLRRCCVHMCRKETEKGRDIKHGSPGFPSLFKDANHVLSMSRLLLSVRQGPFVLPRY